MDALRRIVHVANVVGCRGIVVDAKDAGAENFYIKHGFINVSVELERWPQRVFMPIEWARGVLRALSLCSPAVVLCSANASNGLMEEPGA